MNANNHLFLAQYVGAGGFKKEVLLHLIHQQAEWEKTLQSAKIYALLNHSNIVQVLDVGQHPPGWYIAYEYHEGISLEFVLQRKIALSTVQIVFILTEILQALSYAHTALSQPIHHNNLHPSQILLTKHGAVKLQGFQLENPLPPSSPYRNTSCPLGVRQDLYSCGALLEQLCASSTSPTMELMRFSEQARSFDPQIQFQTAKAMQNILQHRYPLHTTVSLELAQKINEDLSEEWVEQATVISQTIIPNDTVIRTVQPSVEARMKQDQEFPKEQEHPKTMIEAPPSHHIHYVFIILALIVFLFLGFFFGQQAQQRQQTIGFTIPDSYELRINGRLVPKNESVVLEEEMMVEVRNKGDLIYKQSIVIQDTHHQIHIIPLDATTPPNSEP